jgi:tetratricopeptide (TPR) repeat protein
MSTVQPQSVEDQTYDVFISYSHRDAEWVRNWLLPRLERAGLSVCIDFRDFRIGVPSLVNMERAAERSQRTLLVLTPNWVQSEWTNFEALIIQTQDPVGLRRRMLPLMLEECVLPGRLTIFTYADFRERENWEAEVSRLLHQIGEESGTPFVDLKMAAEEPTPVGPEKVSLAKLPSTSPDLFGRAGELAMLDTAWDDPKTNVISLVAWGGVGKTALVNKWLLQMGEEDYRGAERVYGWSFYSQGAAEGKQVSADQFIAAALDWFGDPDPAKGSPWDKGERLAELVRNQRTLLILDGLEPLQYPPGEMEGRLKDPGLQCLLRGLARHNAGLCIITTRLEADDLKDFVGTSVERFPLEHLSPEAGAALLVHLGVLGSPDELRRATDEFDGHALALTLLGSFLSDAYDGDVRCRSEVGPLEEDMRHGGHARRVMASYEKWFGAGPELAALRLLGLFNRPADGPALAVLRATPAIPGLTDTLFHTEQQKGLRAVFSRRKPKPLSDQDWNRTVAKLRRARLLAEKDPAQPDTLDGHPLVREHFGQQLRQEYLDAWREGNNRLYEHLKGTAKEHPDTIEEMAPLFAAVAHGCQAGRYQEALEEVYWRRISRGDEFFSTRKLGAFGADLAALSGFFDPPWRRPVAGLTEADKNWVLGMASFRLRALGRLAEAAQPMQAGLEAYIAREEWKNAAQLAENLSELYLTSGDMAQALAYARQGVDLADRSGDARQRIGGRTNLGESLHAVGRLGNAESTFYEAESLLQESTGLTYLFAAWGFRFCSLLLNQKKHEEVQLRANHTLDSAKTSGALLDIALEHLSLGRAHLLQARQEGSRDFSHAAAHLERAVDGLRQAGTQDMLPLGLLARAELRRVTGSLDRARADLEEALSIATRGGMRLHEADCHLEYARLHLAGGEQEKARESLAKAKGMVEEMGYRRRGGEVAELEGELEPLRP